MKIELTEEEMAHILVGLSVYRRNISSRINSPTTTSVVKEEAQKAKREIELLTEKLWSIADEGE